MTQQQSELAQALAAFQAEMPTVAKGKTATVRTKDGSYQYRYADLADVSQAAMPLLAANGLAFICSPEVTEGGHQLLTGVLLHSSGDSLRGQLALNVGSASTPQQVGSALTYARRYLLGCLTGLVTDDDDDGQAAGQVPRKRAQKATEAPPEPQQQQGGQTVRRQPRKATGRPVENVPLPGDGSPPAESAAWNPDPWAADPRSPQGEPPGASASAPTAGAPHVPQGVPTDGLTDGLRRSLMAATSRVGIDPELDRDMRLALWSALLARRISTANELSRSEGLTLLRRLNDCETGAVEWDYSVETGAVTLRHVDREP